MRNNSKPDAPAQPELPPDLKAEADALLAQGDDLARDPGAPDASQASAQDAPAMRTGAMLADLLDITANGVIAPRRGDHWRMGRDECQALGNAYGAVIDKYWPNLDAGPEATAIVVTLAIIGPRVMRDVELRQERERAKGAAKPQPAASDEPAATPATPARKPKPGQSAKDQVFATGAGS